MEHGFDSRRRYKPQEKLCKQPFQWRFRLVARTHASHAWNTGSIPVGATSVRTLRKGPIFFVYTHVKKTTKKSEQQLARFALQVGLEPTTP